MPASSAELIRAAYAAINRGDLDGFLELVDPEVEFHTLIAEMEGRSFRGHEGVREWWELVRGALGGLEFELGAIEGKADWACAEVTIRATVDAVAVTQRAWQVVRSRDGVGIWWDFARTEAEAREKIARAGV